MIGKLSVRFPPVTKWDIATPTEDTFSYTPTPSPTPTVYVPPTPITTPTPAPIVEKAPTGFADLVVNYRGIPGVVWNEAQTLLQQGSSASVFSVEVGPNTKIQAGLEDPQVYLEQASRLWSKVNQPKTTKVFLFSHFCFCNFCFVFITQ